MIFAILLGVVIAGAFAEILATLTVSDSACSFDGALQQRSLSCWGLVPDNP